MPAPISQKPGHLLCATSLAKRPHVRTVEGGGSFDRATLEWHAHRRLWAEHHQRTLGDDAALRSTATNLAEWIEPPDLTTVAHGVLDALSSAHSEMLLGGMAAAIEELNLAWEVPSPVEIHLNTGKIVSGLFKGLDTEGHLQLLDEDGFTQRVEHPMVERLREILP